MRVSLSVPEAAVLMGASEGFVRDIIIQGKVNWGSGVKKKKWRFWISAIKFTEATGIPVPEGPILPPKKRDKQK